MYVFSARGTMDKHTLLDERFEDYRIPRPLRKLINNNLDEEQLNRSYAVLKRMGMYDNQIKEYAHLLEKPAELMERNYKMLSDIGLTLHKILFQSHLLMWDSQDIERN